MLTPPSAATAQGTKTLAVMLNRQTTTNRHTKIKTMKITVNLLFTIISFACFGQDTLFFDKDWKPAARTNAEFFRIEKKEGAIWFRTDYYYKTKHLQMKGTYTLLTPEKKDGYFEWYHSNGKLKHKGNYENGKQIGEHLWYGDNGNLEAKENYKDGQLDGAYEEYHPKGKLMNKTSFVKGLQSGWTIYYREDGSKQSEGNFKSGNRDGEWKYYDESGKLEGTTVFKIDYEIKEAKMFLKLPNDEWYLADNSDKGLTQYIFKRNEITDPKGRAIVPAIMLYIEDAKDFKQDLVVYSMQKRLAFAKKNIEINNKILIPTDKEFPFPSFKNAMLITASYSDKGLEHIFYMVYIITKDDKGIQLYMDLTKDIADKYEQEFWTTLESIKELK
jgi:antitoxin component YwqK of YwqJK toxin-antitoxin module